MCKVHGKTAFGGLVRSSFLILLLGVCLAGCTASSSKVTPSLCRTNQRGPLSVTVSITPAKPSLADLITFTISAKVPADKSWQVRLPEFGENLKNFMIRDFQRLPLQIRDGFEIHRQRYSLETLVSGKYQIPPLTVRFTLQQKSHTLKSPSLDFQVAALTQGSLKDIADIEPVLDLPTGRPLWVWGLAGGGLVAIAVAALGLYYLLRKPHETVLAPQVAPEERALQALRRLLAENYIEQGRYREFYFALTMIVRQYIEQRYHIQAPTQTTEEFLATLVTSSAFGPQMRQALRRFLLAADVVKYAAHTPTAEEIQASFDTAKSIIGLGEQKS